LNDFLPTRQELCRRHVGPISFCEVCGDPDESIRHVLQDCTIAKLFLEQTRLNVGYTEYTYYTGEDTYTEYSVLDIVPDVTPMSKT
jgi:hypothetical protein